MGEIFQRNSGGGLMRLVLKAVKWQNRLFSAWSCRLMYITGRSSQIMHPKHLYVSERPWYLDHLDSCETLVDLGSGLGTACTAAVQKAGCKTAIGIERDWKNLKSAAVLAGRASSTEWINGDLEDPLPLADESADIILISDVLEHLNNRHSLLTETRRVLKRGGKVLISVPNRDTSWKRKLRHHGLSSFDDDDHKIEYSEDELRKEIESAGFSIEGDLLPIVLSTPFSGIIDLSAVVAPLLYRRLWTWKREGALRNPNESIGWRLAARRL